MSSATRPAIVKTFSDLNAMLMLTTTRLIKSKGCADEKAIPAERARPDILLLAAALSQQATRVGVAAKPPVSGQTGWAALQETGLQLLGLVNKCAFITQQLGTSLLAQELRWAATDLLEAVQNLAGSLATSFHKSGSLTAVDRERHLALVGVVWSNVERISQCSTTEREAASKALSRQLETMEDGLDEARELLDATGGLKSDIEADAEDEATENLTELERKRVESALRFLTSAKRLVRRIVVLLERTQAPAIEKPADLARMHKLVADIVASEDDLVSTLPGPQDVDELRSYASTLLRDAESLAHLAIELWPPDPVRPDIEALLSEFQLDDSALVRDIPLQAFGEHLTDVGRALVVI